MGDYNLGSVAEDVLALVENIPTSISGVQLEKIADREREFAQEYTGQGIGSNAITIQFQGAIIDLTAATTLSSMETLGVDASSVELGDLTVKKGGQSNTSTAAKQFKKSGTEKLREIGRKMPHYKANG